MLGISAGGCGLRPHSSFTHPLTGQRCVPEEPGADLLYGYPDELLEAWRAGQNARVLAWFEESWQRLETEATGVLGASEERPSAREIRDFLDRWAFSEPPLVVVDVDAFRLSHALGVLAVMAALGEGDTAGALQWAERSAFTSQERRDLQSCLSASDQGRQRATPT